MDVRILKPHLDALYATYDAMHLSPDPLELVRRFDRPEDLEIAGLIASSLAYGRVRKILYSVDRVFRAMDHRPYRFAAGFDPRRDAGRFEGFVHRFNRGADVACLISFVRQILETYGSIEDFFHEGYEDSHEHVGPALTSFSERMLAMDAASFYDDGSLPKEAGVRFFLPSPRSGSTCKRLNLFLKWMVRNGDGIDLGIWTKIPPSKLIMPVDTHVARIARYIGLTRRRSTNWRMAEEITANLKRLDPEDPTKYDFALARLGILGRCSSREDGRRCDACELRPICKAGGRRPETENTEMRRQKRQERTILLPPASCLLPPASCLLPPASCLLPPASCRQYYNCFRYFTAGIFN